MVSRQVMDATDPATRTAIERRNATQRLDGLPDALNPGLIDMAKFDALVAALGPDSATALAGRPVTLDPRRLRIGTSAPTTPASFQAPLVLKLVQEHTNSLDVEAQAKIDCTLARNRAAEARTLTQQAERDVAAATQRRDTGTPARKRRWAAARVWEENAEAAATCQPADPTLAADKEAATKAADAAILLGGSMQ